VRGFASSHLSLRDKDLFLFLHTVQSPPHDEWARPVAAFAACDARNGGDLSRMGFFVVTDGGGPDSDRRAEHNRFLRGRVLRTTVVTDNALVRGLVAHVDSFNPAIQAFAPQHALRAMAHAGLDAGDQDALADELVRLQATMDPIRSLDALLRFIRRPPSES
jgi:hypothetical protein